ncbi:multidrug/spermidine efflux SMR transporter subunit MdtI [Reyranella sp. CPCC 100927]|uniref:multidrug/spermidine efflux SMR transporter subunit MdtI n=1 Tax=Reyranella sp. CPCC 100927 TaxID=2599616 RepID=UPI0011B7934A|nr:multidrug/spermidine efflux SMR transporter subunit MdtI [Reyranella sp. CPCC 100927]TWT13887.1 multidrug/spermidine efflux SMR transporter subunit MdtI [Reyranella sp. CPCC 100927]
MSLGPDIVALLWLAASIVLELTGTMLLKRSDGFRRRRIGLLGLACVLASFATLAQAIQGMDLSVAYALWGGVGILATAALGWLLFDQRIRLVGWCGVALIVAGATVLNLS